MIKEFAFINFFRAIAAFWVLSAHCMIWGNWNGIPIPNPKIAVDLFMIISGYLMAANAFARNQFEPLTTWRNWLRFYLRRYFRLAPAYYLSLTLAIIFSSYFLKGYHELQILSPERWLNGGVYDPTRIQYTLENIILHISFLFGLHPTYSFSTFLPDWSLSLEMQFYFVFPALLLSMKKFGFIKIAFGIGVLAFIIGLGIQKNAHYYEPSLLLMKLNYFIAGILLFRVFITNTTKHKRILLTLCAFFLVSIDYRYGKQLLVLPLLLLAMFTLGWLEKTNKTPKLIFTLINCRLTRFASDSSYGVYLFHGFFISASGLIIAGNSELIKLLPYQRVFLMFLFVTTMAYFTAWLVYRLIELPSIALGKKFIKKVAPIQTTKNVSETSV
jgi:peptidoglycan/LPS O-acetylase OafA/YrhL